MKHFKYKSSIDFPDPRVPAPEGIVAVGGKLDVGTLYRAYDLGIFPWPHPDYPMLWFCPEERGILEFREFHVPKSLKKFLKNNSNISFSINTHFPEILEECAIQPRPGQDGTWITNEIKKSYMDFYYAGFVVSLAVLENGKLIGGIYGVLVNGVFSGESMFFKKDNASKLALWKLVEYFQALGHSWIDVQMVTPVIGAMGGKLISREDFLTLLQLRHYEINSL